ncbi:MAG TPA: cytochrome c peroxidase [Rhodocyclaceae bacterium]|nr:cytochrome c peroxidase [Rhodocyclaceae bacterium]
MFSPLNMGILSLFICTLMSARLHGCGSGLQAKVITSSTSSTDSFSSSTVAPSAIAQLGKKIYFDQSLSASGKMACSTCHSPDHYYGPANDLAVQLGGFTLDAAGNRVAPEITYAYRNPAFSIGPDNPALENVNFGQSAAAAGGNAIPRKIAGAPAANTTLVPQGGLFWDGRVNTLQEQTDGPLFNPVEMANSSINGLAAKLAKTAYAGDFLKLFGANIFNNPRLLVSEAEDAIARFEFEDPSFHRFNSKYDYYLAGKSRLSDVEMRGLKLFEDPDKGNCAACHPDRKTAEGQPPMFTDFQYEALGVPRNSTIPANADAKYYDLGLCGPFRSDLKMQASYCGMFRTPSLRNVATRKVFFHNGVYESLDDVLQFYMFRDIDPERFYSKAADGGVLKFDDLPARYRSNVDVSDAPFNRHPGDVPALSNSELQDLIVFLKTLTDGYRPGSAYR